MQCCRLLGRSLSRQMAFTTPPEVLLRNAVRAHKPSLSTVAASSGPYRAAVVKELGKPMVIEHRQLPSSLESGQVLVAVEAAGVNFSDVLQAQGQYQVKVAPPYVPGVEFCGRVHSVGDDVSNVTKGQKIVALARTVGMDGSFAEYCVLDSMAAFPIPDSLPSVTAASALISYGTAMMTLTRTIQVKAGETVLVTAAAGAAGLAFVDIASHVMGATVIGVCGGPEKCALVRERGATHTIDYNSEDIRKRVKEITDGRGVDVVLDQVGGDIFIQCLKSIAWEGRLVTVGYASGKIPSIPANLILLKSCSVHGVFWGNYSVMNPSAFVQSVLEVMAALKAGKIHPYCGKTFPLEQINDAFDFLKSRKSTGKVVLTM